MAKERKPRARKKRTRANGEGCCFKLPDGRYAAVGTAELPDGTKKRIKREAKTRAEAKDRLTKAIADAEQGIYGRATIQTVDDYLRWWFDTIAVHKYAPNTVQAYRRAIDQVLIPAIGKIALRKLTHERVQTLFSDLRARYVRSTVEQYRAVLRAAMKQALKSKLIVLNPVSDTEIFGEIESAGKMIRPEQARTLLDAARPHRLGVFVRLAFHGMRRSEIAGLHLDDLYLDADPPHIQINGAMSFAKPRADEPSQLTYRRTKTKKSRRVIALSAGSAAALRWHLARREAEQRTQGWDNSSYVFRSSRTGEPLHPGKLYEAFIDICKDAGITGFRLHDCRHSAASFLIADNVQPKKIAELLGHSSIEITLDTYGHLMSESMREVAELLGAVLDRPDVSARDTQQEQAQ